MLIHTFKTGWSKFGHEKVLVCEPRLPTKIPPDNNKLANKIFNTKKLALLSENVALEILKNAFVWWLMINAVDDFSTVWARRTWWGTGWSPGSTSWTSSSPLDRGAVFMFIRSPYHPSHTICIHHKHYRQFQLVMSLTGLYFPIHTIIINGASQTWSLRRSCSASPTPCPPSSPWRRRATLRCSSIHPNNHIFAFWLAS